MKPILIIRTGHAPDAIRARYGDFPQWLRVAAALDASRVREVHVAGGEALPSPREVAGALITGSAAMVTEKADWSERTAGWIRDAMDIELPLLGVCYGHQLMAHAMGGRVDYLPGGREIGTVQIELSADAASDSLLSTCASSFRAHATHEQSVLELPAGARALARSHRDPYHLLRYGRRAVSVQFHPEFNADIMRAYIRRKHRDMQREGFDPEATFRQISPTPLARRLLRRFAQQHRLGRMDLAHAPLNADEAAAETA